MASNRKYIVFLFFILVVALLFSYKQENFDASQCKTNVYMDMTYIGCDKGTFIQSLSDNGKSVSITCCPFDLPKQPQTTNIYINGVNDEGARHVVVNEEKNS